MKSNENLSVPPVIFSFEQQGIDLKKLSEFMESAIKHHKDRFMLVKPALSDEDRFSKRHERINAELFLKMINDALTVKPFL
jgi:hypothetical protein